MIDQKLIDSVIAQIVRDVKQEDYTAIEELLTHTPEQYLKGFLSETNEETIR